MRELALAFSGLVFVLVSTIAHAKPCTSKPIPDFAPALRYEIVNTAAPVRSAPRDGCSVVESVKPGAIVDVFAEKSGWKQVRVRATMTSQNLDIEGIAEHLSTFGASSVEVAQR